MKNVFLDSLDGSGFARVLYVFFLGVVPFISISLFLLYYWQQNRGLIIRRVPTEYVPKKPKFTKNNLHISETKLVFSTNPHVLSTSTELILNNI